jgi:hypothetical protein
MNYIPVTGKARLIARDSVMQLNPTHLGKPMAVSVADSRRAFRLAVMRIITLLIALIALVVVVWAGHFGIEPNTTLVRTLYGIAGCTGLGVFIMMMLLQAFLE